MSAALFVILLTLLTLALGVSPVPWSLLFSRCHRRSRQGPLSEQMRRQPFFSPADDLFDELAAIDPVVADPLRDISAAGPFN